MPRKPRKRRPTIALPSGTSADALFRSLATAGKQYGTHAEWVRDAVDLIGDLARTRTSITALDLYDVLGRPDDSRAAGTAFRDAARAGYVRNSGRTVQIERREGVENPRRRPMAVWESIL